MKKKSIVPVLIFAAPAFAFILPVNAGTDQKSVTIEKSVDVHTSGTATVSGVPMTPPAPVTFLGVEVAPVDEALAAQLKLPPEHGLVVRFVAPDSPAAAAGVQKHDVLTRLDDQLLIAPRQLSALVRSRKEGDSIKLTYVRAGAEARATARLVTRVPPPVPVADNLHWIGEAGAVHAFPAHRSFTFRSEAGPAGAMIDEDRVFVGPPVGSGPHVMLFRPQARIVYREGDVTLEVTTTENGRQLEARGADGAILFSGSIDTPEQRKAVPAELQKHLEKLNALEPAPFPHPLPAPSGAPQAMPLPAPAHSMTWEAEVPAAGGSVIRHSRTGPAHVPGADGPTHTTI